MRRGRVQGFIEKVKTRFREGKKFRLIAGGLLAVVTLPPGIFMLIYPDSAKRLFGVAYISVFVVNFLVQLPVIPIPGASSLGQALIVTQASHSPSPWILGLAGGLGMGLGEIPPYFLGSIGTSVVDDDPDEKEGRIRRWLDEIAGWIEKFMQRWAIPTIFVMSAIPNPFLEITSVSAGAVGVPFRKFVPALVAGKVVRGLLLSLIGRQLSLF